MRYLVFLSRTDIFCINIVWFIFILINGTLVQKDIGIYSAIEIFFASYIIWIFDIIPIPGGFICLVFLFINLFAKLFVDNYNSSKVGTVLIHIGILFFLLGAFFSSRLSSEGIMIIKEGEKSNFYVSESSYSILLSNNNGTFKLPVIYNNSIIRNGNFHVSVFGKSINIVINNFYKNCDLEIINDGKIFYKIKKNRTFPESEYDRAGISIFFDGIQLYILEDLELSYFLPELGTVNVSLVKSDVYLPFHISLLSFKKDVYLKTNLAKSYKSVILIDQDPGICSKFDIEMNKPFRFDGYTFYQTSFISKEDYTASVFTVVNNPGNFIFYLATFIVFLGLFIHILKFFKLVYYE